MLIELLSSDNYVQYNVRIAQLLGLNTAVYLSELLRVSDKAIRKAKLNDNNYFTLDRKYIEKRTTLSKYQQLNIDKKLIELEILKVDENQDNILSLNLAILISLLNDDTPLTQKNCKIEDNTNEEQSNVDCNPKQSKKGRKTKEETSKLELKNSIQVCDDRLKSAYYEWIDSVFTKVHWMSNKSVYVAQRIIEEVSGGNIEISLKILEIAAVNGWKDITWAVKIYKQDYEPTYRLKYSKQPQVENRSVQNLGEEVF